jgi:general secretion pathway protein D
LQMQIVNNAPINPSGQSPTLSGSLVPGNLREIVGLQPPAGGAGFPNWTSNLDLPFNQSSFNLATPQFGQPAQVANFGFAILSDLEAFLLVNASQGDRRSNVLQAPKVTMFNGQFASVIDVTQTPFVISVIPVVGDFAAAYQPVITVLSEGTALTVQAVISNDRRFVRLTVVPFFSTIGDVQEFTFSGSKTTTNNSSASKASGGSSGDSTASADNATSTTDGVTVQLPNFSIVSVQTTVSVPDGGTVLLGGIKRLNEGRNEFGVPILSKLPYISRLFKNVGIGRETQSLMMMVTPRIIIQEEEEERLGIQAPP